MNHHGNDVPSHVSIERHLEKVRDLRNRVFENQNGCAERTVVGTTIRRIWSLVDTWRKLDSGVLGMLEWTQ